MENVKKWLREMIFRGRYFNIYLIRILGEEEIERIR